MAKKTEAAKDAAEQERTSQPPKRKERESAEIRLVHKLTGEFLEDTAGNPVMVRRADWKQYKAAGFRPEPDDGEPIPPDDDDGDESAEPVEGVG